MGPGLSSFWLFDFFPLACAWTSSHKENYKILIMGLTQSFWWKWWWSLLRAYSSRRCSWGAWKCQVHALRTRALWISSSRMPIASISSVKSWSERLLESELNAAMESSLDSARESEGGSHESDISVSKLLSVVVGGILLISSSSRSSTRLWY
jgi:hypothetical protein